MKHTITVNGFGFRLRPVTLNDAETIIKIRLQDPNRNQYIHAVSPDVEQQKKWLESYFTREGDYYFIIENKLTKQAEGLISIYDVKDQRAEWGRWVVCKGSLCATESVDLMFKAAFERLKLQEVYARTIADNESVVRFHDINKEKFRCVHQNYAELNGKMYDVVEHYVDKEYYYSTLRAGLEAKSQKIYLRNLRVAAGPLTFHHIAVACADLEKEFDGYKMLGYVREGNTFEDPTQGIKGQFITAENQPRLELLENLPESKTLSYWLEHRVKMYHFAYLVKNFDKAVAALTTSGAKLISPAKQSVYFGQRICFFILPNMFMVELIEE